MREIRQAIIAGVESEEFHRLLVNFGLWSRYCGAPGYHGAPISETPAISDDAALYVDRCLVRLKALHKLGFWIFKNYHIYGQSCVAIAIKLNRIGRETHDFAYEHATGKSVQELLALFRMKLYNIMEEGLK